MRNPEGNWDPKKEEFELIAAELKVPDNKRDYFFEESQIIGELFRHANSTVDNPREGRRELFMSLEATLKGLKKAKLTLESKAAHCDLVLSSEFRASLGEIVSPPGVRRQLSKPSPLAERDIRDFWDSARQDSITEDVTPDALTRAGRTVFSQNPGHAFCALLDLQCNMLERELSGWKRDGGGPSRMRVRAYFLAELLLLHDKVFDKPATSTPNASFCTMCDLLFQSFGVPTTGLDVAINRFLTEQRSKSS